MMHVTPVDRVTRCKLILCNLGSLDGDDEGCVRSSASTGSTSVVAGGANGEVTPAQRVSATVNARSRACP